jgi:hypothetical protein
MIRYDVESEQRGRLPVARAPGSTRRSDQVNRVLRITIGSAAVALAATWAANGGTPFGTSGTVGPTEMVVRAAPELTAFSVQNAVADVPAQAARPWGGICGGQNGAEVDRDYGLGHGEDRASVTNLRPAYTYFYGNNLYGGSCVGVGSGTGSTSTAGGSSAGTGGTGTGSAGGTGGTGGGTGSGGTGGGAGGGAGGTGGSGGGTGGAGGGTGGGGGMGSSG